MLSDDLQVDCNDLPNLMLAWLRSVSQLRLPDNKGSFISVSQLLSEIEWIRRSSYHIQGRSLSVVLLIKIYEMAIFNVGNTLFHSREQWTVQKAALSLL